MPATFEQALEIVSALPPAELHKLRRWMQTHQQATLRGKEQLSEQTNLEVAKFKLAMKWIADHRQDYLGQWVCLEGDQLISSGADGVQVHHEAKAQGVEIPFVVHVVSEPEFYYSGGIEICR